MDALSAYIYLDFCLQLPARPAQETDVAPPHQFRHLVYPPTIRKLYATADVEKLNTSGEIFTLQLGSTMTIDLCI